MKRIHPVAIILGLLAFAVAVNIAFMVVAARNADPVVPSYHLEER